MAGGYYLMSACQTADEFVAAFRRYAEKAMLFVPTQTPLASGTRTRIAVTLADGSVMIEGDAEVVSATARAVGLHARAGMSVRFIELDDTSQQVLDQLVRARLTSRPVPLPMHLRPRPRAGTVPEPSPELAAERARATSTVLGMAPIPKVNAEAVPAECSLVEVPDEPAAEVRRKPPDLAARFDYSAPAPREDSADVEIEVHAEATVRADGPPAPELAPVAQPDPSIEVSVEEISVDAIEPVESDPPSMPVPSPPRLPSEPRGRQSMSRTMLGVTPIVLQTPGPAPATTPMPETATAAPATTPMPATATPQAEVFAAWWPDGEPQPVAEAGAGAEPEAARLPPAPHHEAPPPIALEAAFSAAPAGSFPQPFPEAGPPPVFEDNTSIVEAGKRRGPSRVVIASFGGAMLFAVILVVIATGGGKKADEAAADGSASASASGAVASATPDAATAAIAPLPSPSTIVDAGVAKPPVPVPAPVPTGTCRARFTSTPPGADVVLDGKVAGATPIELALPCRAATATFRRARYQSKDVAFTPTADQVAVTAHLDRPTFTVRVTSTPAGATVTIAGKVVGKTPLSTRAPGFEAVTVAFKKDGFAPATARLYAKANGTAVKATLRRGGAAPPKAPPKKPATRHR